MTVSAVLLAAGKGRRFGAGVNKVLLPIGGTPIVSRAAAALAGASGLVELIVVASPDELGAVASLLPPLFVPVRVIAGGERRQDSSLAGVRAARGDLVVVHDAARPFASPSLMARVVDGARRHGACIPVVPMSDTLRRVDPRGFATSEAIPRDGLSRVQTPQAFRRDLLLAALTRWPAETEMTDDATAVLASGALVTTVAGDVWNIKITTQADLEIASHLADGAQSSS